MKEPINQQEGVLIQPGLPLLRERNICRSLEEAGPCLVHAKVVQGFRFKLRFLMTAVSL